MFLSHFSTVVLRAAPPPSPFYLVSAAEEKRCRVSFFDAPHDLGGQPGQIGDSGPRAPSCGVGGGDRGPAERDRGDGKDSSLAGGRWVRARECANEERERERIGRHSIKHRLTFSPYLQRPLPLWAPRNTAPFMYFACSLVPRSLFLIARRPASSPRVNTPCCRRGAMATAGDLRTDGAKTSSHM